MQFNFFLFPSRLRSGSGDFILYSPYCHDIYFSWQCFKHSKDLDFGNVVLFLIFVRLISIYFSPNFHLFNKLVFSFNNDRVFSDRLVDDNDREVFLNLLSEKLGTMMDFSYHNLCPNKVPPIFGMFLYYPNISKEVYLGDLYLIMEIKREWTTMNHRKLLLLKLKLL